MTKKIYTIHSYHDASWIKWAIQTTTSKPSTTVDAQWGCSILDPTGFLPCEVRMTMLGGDTFVFWSEGRCQVWRCWDWNWINPGQARQVESRVYHNMTPNDTPQPISLIYSSSWFSDIRSQSLPWGCRKWLETSQWVKEILSIFLIEIPVNLSLDLLYIVQEWIQPSAA